MKQQVAVVTDTTACIPAEQVAANNIVVVPIQLIIANKAYRDGIDMKPSEFYALLRQSKKLPTTSSSAPEQYLEAFRLASRTAPHILCLVEPSRFSAMFNSASVAADLARDEMDGISIDIIDATTAAAGLGLVALAAAREANLNRPLDKVKASALHIMSRVNLYATLDTLQYLARSGRVPQAAAMVNSILNIKPVFTLNHADAHTVALPRTTKSAMNRMLKLMETTARRHGPLHVAVMHADAPNEAEIFENKINSRFGCREIFITEFTPVMGVHTGPGLFGVAFYTED
jgi:DegV family protein with EDD domain